jgi:hypothetical protein
VLVCGGVLVLQNKTDIPRGKFKTPYINGKYVYPILFAVAMVLSFTTYKQETLNFLAYQPAMKEKSELLMELTPNQLQAMRASANEATDSIANSAEIDLETYYADKPTTSLIEDIKAQQITGIEFYHSSLYHFAHKIPTWIFIVFATVMLMVVFKHNLSLIPLLGLLSCLYMMSQIELKNWIAFTAWLLLGLLIYFGYSRKRSKLQTN